MKFSNTRFRGSHIPLLFILLISFVPCKAQEPPSLDVESIISGTYNSKSSERSSWLNKETGYTIIENKRRKIALYNPKNGKKSVLFDIEDVIEADSVSNILSYQFSEDESNILLTLQIAGKDSYFIFNCDSKAVTKIPIDKYALTIQMIKLSPNNNFVSFIHEGNIFIYDIENKKNIQLTLDGGLNIINATSNTRVYSAHSMQQYYWDPTSNYIVFNQFNTEGVRSFAIINNTDSTYPSINEFLYVKPGETLPSVRTGVIDISTKQTTWLNIEGHPRNNYITNLTWNPGSHELFIQQMNRKQNTMHVLRADIVTGNTERIFSESEETFIEPFQLVWINEGRNFLWMSENDGWRHIYSIGADRKDKKLITPGNFDVAQLNGTDQSNKWVYFQASPNSTIHEYLYRIKMDGSGSMQRLTPKDVIGSNSYSISPSGEYAFRYFSRFDKPMVKTLVSLPKHTEIKVFEDNAALLSKINSIDPSPVEYSKIEIEEGVSLDTWMIKPQVFDPKRKYPSIYHVYSMPAGKSTNDTWKGNNYMFYQLLAKKGFIVIGIDGRGTPSLEGRDWRKSIYLKHGILPADDIAKATKIMLSNRPFMDGDRIGVYGWSGGGLMSLMLILRYPELFNTAIPGAYISHHQFYQSGFTERFLGTPQENPAAYEETALLNYAKNLQGNLLLIHGTGDDNVHYQNTEALIKKLIEEKKRFFVMPYPNTTHNFSKKKVFTIIYLIHICGFSQRI